MQKIYGRLVSSGGAVSFTALLLALWALAANFRLVSPVFLPRPLDAGRALVEGIQDGTLVAAMQITTGRMLQGWMLASLVGIAIGAVVGMFKVTRDFVQPTIEFLRPLPASAIIPVAVAFMGIGPEMALIVVVFGSVWPTLLSTIHGFSSIEPRLSEVARCLGFGRARFAWSIALPNAIPDIASGMRISLSNALSLSVVCEMLAAQGGLGTVILLAARSFQAADLFAGIALLGMLGFISSSALGLVEQKILRWRAVEAA